MRAKGATQCRAGSRAVEEGTPPASGAPEHNQPVALHRRRTSSAEGMGEGDGRRRSAVRAGPPRQQKGNSEVHGVNLTRSELD